MGLNIHLKCLKGKKSSLCKQPLPPQAQNTRSQQRQQGQSSPCIPWALLRSAGQGHSWRKDCPDPVPPPLQTILFLPTPVLHGTLDENFATYFMPAALIDMIAMQLQHRQTQVWKWGLGKGLMKEHSQNLTSCLYSSLFFTWYPLNAQQYTAQIFSP